MLSDWYQNIRLPMSIDDFQRLPRNPAYKYEYVDGEAHLSPRPKTLNALLPLSPIDAPRSLRAFDPVSFRTLESSDWTELPGIFLASFGRVQPFAGLSEENREAVAVECVEQTRTGGDGPLLQPACFVAEANNRILGGILITLIPKRDAGDWWDALWFEPPPPNAAALGLARPHLTWVFVSPMHAGRGVGTALLAHAIKSLLALGFTDLGSTFSLGNESSTLWHWRNGFQLMPYPGSLRLPSYLVER